MNLNLRTPDHTTFSRRQKELEVILPHRKKRGPIHVVVDSTWLKVYGEGETECPDGRFGSMEFLNVGLGGNCTWRWMKALMKF
jgi:hypothetical protein